MDIDFSKRIFDEMIIVKREGYDLYVVVSYERLLEFCTHYVAIEHAESSCKKLRKKLSAEEDRMARVATRNITQYVEKFSKQ